ncbi:hypothetical protein [Candidatus Protochlamydia phocaeensis]|uniref:hypothetical protein n=1 Tax=Candidatus Protochlamydia phocaeensis TaxID=1414722 RepID=UPI000837ACD4|nr:hypothetical protein [Candidatus Protochlamydia phocaeensis]
MAEKLKNGIALCLSLLIGLWMAALSAQQPETVSFEQLLDPAKRAAYQNQFIQIKGFPYQTSGGQWILAAQPNLRSCCIGTQATISNQLFLKMPLADLPTQHALFIRGLFKEDPVYDREGKLIQLYVLDQAEIVSHPSFPFTALSISGLVLLIGLLFFYRRHGKRTAG